MNIETRYLAAKNNALTAAQRMLDLIIPDYGRPLYGPAHERSGLRAQIEDQMRPAKITSPEDAGLIYSALERRAKSWSCDHAWDSPTYHVGKRVDVLMDAAIVQATAEAVLLIERILVNAESAKHHHHSVVVARMERDIEIADRAVALAQRAVRLAESRHLIPRA
jgi:hypothetical protein